MRFQSKVEDLWSFWEFEESKRKLEYLVSTYSVNFDQSKMLNEIVKKSWNEREKELSYYICREHIFEQIAKQSMI